uniref:CLP1_P domain-containing protein n=1 Tax=Panagrellus redivivus TaxID=6233 RepID=A0A7E4VQR6_PANRE
MAAFPKGTSNGANGSGDGVVNEEWMSPVFHPDDERSEFRVVLIHPKKALNLCGAGRLACVLGTVEINGYKFVGRDFDANQMVPFCVPYRTIGSTQCVAEKISFEEVNKEMLTKRFGSLKVNVSAILTYIVSQHYWGILVIGPPPPMYSPIETVLGSEFLRQPPMTTVKSYRSITPTSFQLQFGDALFTLERKVVVQRVDQAIENEYEKRKRTVIMAVGRKDTGKSTFNRYMVNRMLNHINDRSAGKKVNVYFIDLDVGQSEFNPPGLVGVHKINGPVLSTALFSQVPTLTSAFFYGSNTPEVDTKHYKHIVQVAMEEFYRVSQADDHSIAIVNNIGWVDYTGEEIMQHVISTVKPHHLVSFQDRRATFNVKAIDPSLQIRKHLVAGYVHPANPNRFSPSTLRDYSLAAYLTHSFQRNQGVIVDSFNRCTVRVVPFNDIQLFFHPESLVDDRFIFNTLNTATVALCSVQVPANGGFNTDLIRGRGDLPKKLVPVPNAQGQNPALRCYGYAFIRAISLEERCFYVITPVAADVLKNVTVMALGHEIGTPKYIFQAQSTAGGPYLMSTGGNVDREFNQLSMPIKIVSCSKRR